MWKLRFLELWCWGSLSSWGARGGQKWEEVEGTCQKWEEVEETWEVQIWEAVVAAAEGENMRQLMMDLAPTEHSQVIPHQIITEGSPDLPNRMNFLEKFQREYIQRDRRHQMICGICAPRMQDKKYQNSKSIPYSNILFQICRAFDIFLSLSDPNCSGSGIGDRNGAFPQFNNRWIIFMIIIINNLKNCLGGAVIAIYPSEWNTFFFWVEFDFLTFCQMADQMLTSSCLSQWSREILELTFP